MRTSFLCGILCLCFGINWGQSSGKFQHAEVILQNGETRTGLIVTNFQNSKVLRFKTSESAAESAIELPQIKEVRIGDTERLVPYCPTDASAAGCQWLVTLLDGKVGLYRNINDANLYYLQEEGAFYVIKLNTLSGIVTALQSKCAAFKQLNGKYRFTSSSLLQMVNDYSQCKYPGQTQVNVPKTYHEKTAQLYLGIQLGFNQGSTAIRENLFADRYFKGGGFRDQVGITFGMPVELQIGKHLAIQSGLHFLHRSTLRDSVNIRFTFEEYFNQIKFSLTYLDIPFMLQYRFGSEKLEPFVQVGAQVGMPLARKFSHTAYDSNLDYDTPQHKFQAMNIGFRAGLGVNKSLGDKLKLQLLGQYIRYSTFFEHTMPAFLEGNQIESSIFQVSGGLLWRVSK